MATEKKTTKSSDKRGTTQKAKSGTSAGKASTNKKTTSKNTTNKKATNNRITKNSKGALKPQTKKGTRKEIESTDIAARTTVEVQDKKMKPERRNTGVISPGAETFIWVMLGFCIILCLANFWGIGGVFGRGISYFFFGMFGLIGYLIPFILFIGTCFIIVNLSNRSLWGKIGSFILLLISISCFCQLFSGDFDGTQSILSYYETGAELRAGGGFLGGIVCVLFYPFVGTIGTWICNIILFIISLVTLTGQSAITGIYHGGKKVISTYGYAGNSTGKRSQYQLEDFEKTPRRNRVASGVSLDTKLEQEDLHPDDVREIQPLRNTESRKNYILKPAEDAPEVQIMDSMKNRSRKPNIAKKLVDTVDEGDVSGKQMEFPISGLVAKEETEADWKEEKEREPEAEESVIKREIKKNPKSSKQEQEDNLQKVDDEIRRNELKPKKEYHFPPIKLLGKGTQKGRGNSQTEVRETAAKLQNTLESFGVNVTITNVSCGPAVTRYELMPDQGVKVSKIVNLSDDIKLNLAASDIRIEAPIPGKAAIGIEVPNKENSAVFLRELLETESFTEAKSNLTFAVGKDIAGQPVIADIAKMPHLLIAGATGSGKSVCINTLIMSILYKADPEKVKLIMIDPKVVELSVYNGIPHLMIPVVTDPKKASGALNWAVAEMTNRYEKFSQVGVRDLAGYNKRVDAIPDGTEGKPERLPQIVIIVDELADLMMVAPGEVEDAICRLAQLARAAGLHLIIATQRPSVNVITGLIKANMPSRIAFSVTSGVDSRTILDMIGAEKLLGKGDMLFYPQGYPKPIRVQGAFVTDEEVGRVTDFLKENWDEEQFGEKKVIDIDKYSVSASASGVSQEGGSERDSYFVEAGKFIIEKDKASIGMLQRVFKIGFNRAARIMDQLADAGVVGPEEGTKPRKILMSMEEFEQFIDEYF